VCLCEKSRSAVSDIPRVFHVDFGVSRNARLRRAAENARRRDRKNRFFFFSKKKGIFPPLGFGFSARNGRTRVRVFGAFSKTHPTRFFFPGGKKRLR
jgi:hypothetical protein